MAIPNAIKKTFNLPDGREISIETGKLAKQADGSVEVRMGDTILLATVVSNKEAREGVDFLPMSVDYQEKFASSGKIPGGFLKREGKLSDYEVLTSRLVDRALRPLFPSDYHAETQVMIQLFSLEENDLPDALAALAASAALTASDIPFAGPISEVRVGRVNGEMIINPNSKQLEESDIDMIVAATIDNIMMVEGELKEISEQEMVEAINFAHESIKLQCQAQLDLAKDAGKTEKREYNHEEEPDAELEKEIFDKYYQQFFDIAAKGLADKAERARLFSEIKDGYIDSLPEDTEISLSLAKSYLSAAQKKAVRNATLETRSRLDGRKLDEIRPIWSEIDYLPSAHGSAVFTRGETQSLTTVTLGTKLDEQMVDGAVHSGYNKFILHYNFPAFSTGEARPNRGPGRREVGHGNLALRALKQILPTPDELPYTIRVVSDILESNGSSSMATVCAGSLALMDAGIPIKAPVSGIAMGLISDPETGKYAILSDILGDEDHIGDMDFKVTGTEKGITACQMDIKVDGLSSELMMEALNQAKAGRDHIRNEMSKTIAAPREDYKPNAPRVVNIEIDREMIGAVIGPGGKVVQEIQKTTGATVVIEETEKGGKINVFAVNKESLDQAVKWIKGIVAKPEVGEVYDGIVKAIQPYGAFVEIMPGKDGLLHISEIKHEKIDNLEGILEIGEEVKVKLIDIDKKTGKLRLSRKVLLPKPEKEEK
ncbi:polyribonucleotide nucleotidyltransferase [Marivirga tractuosa]|uniref:Polyribonucleotide nucleotidyltransferase n=1 Tax=Marivirga tractuosa (strain ATCC 23168 / DSM 4126 / NBRC 15989 / NCIMB 1408 / VKM B-1430 / H-43) TaxID=643867 RepID=E4TL88_MARTH|nr:polyribonucleotide nucleotidyltransferase [Marivirga tractuosa]ADR20226.1 polyribonucleotide nucleotidyltransferase [Marivirga tractuosa DSM 4126]BDD15333.1 polyribonucleotide nucleotidyltransferase [Marivirga tractuosa]